jgi:outer membrane protein TolC
MSGRVGWLAVMLILGAGPTWAQSQGPTPLSLDEAIRRAVEGAPRVAQRQAREAAAEAVTRGRAALARPIFSTSLGFQRTNHVEDFGFRQANGEFQVIFPDVPNNYRARAELTVPLYTGGRVEALVASGDADVRAAQASRHATEADLTLEVSMAYWAVVTARERVTLMARSLARADGSLAEVTALVDTGILPPNDRLSAQAQRARQQVQVIEAEQAAAIAEAGLARLIGSRIGEALLLTTPVTRPDPAAMELVTIPIEALLARAGTTRPERRALVERQISLEAAAEAARARTRPQVAAVAGVEPARPNMRFIPRTDEWRTGWDVSVQMNWSLWDGGRAQAEAAATVAEREAVGAEVREFDQVLGVELQRRVLDVVTTRAAIQASSEAVAAATEARRVVGERFTAGVATTTDILDAEVSQLEAELERNRLQASLRVGEAQLVRAVGKP